MQLSFTTRLVKSNPDKSVYYGFSVVILLTTTFVGLAYLKMYDYATIAFIAAMLILIGLLIVKKGRIQTIILSTEPLVLTPTHIKVGDHRYNVDDIDKPGFKLHSYSGMSLPDSSGDSDGMENIISFYHGGKRQEHKFFLGNRKHALELCAVLREYYRAGMAIVELDHKNRRTILMYLPGSVEEMKQFKKRHKIP